MNKYGIVARSEKDAKSTDVYKAKTAELAKRYSEEYTIERYNECGFCGKPFPVNSSTKHKKFCSEECRKGFVERRRSDKKFFCENCGKEIEYSESRKYKRKYCDECASKRLWTKENKIDTECAYCHKKIRVIPSRYKSNQSCYCDVECMAKDYATKYSGENSPTWKGGKTHHYTGGFFSARNQARLRDGFTCQRCGITEDEYGKELSVHHLHSYRDYEDKTEANDLSNLISLCEPCHRFVHSNANTEKLFIQ